MQYYASKISPNMAKTRPEGYLICKNVPIARIGSQKYLAGELPIPYGDPTALIDVYRDEEDVFAPAAIASFEGKPVTNEHPDVDVGPENIREYMKGIATKIRRGSGTESDMLLADLVIYDAGLIKEVEDGKREVSCSYKCKFVELDGRLYQTHIEGNHVAVVSAGRAGQRAAIKDSCSPLRGDGPSGRRFLSGTESPKIDNIGATQKIERSSRMSKKRKPSGKGILSALTGFLPHVAKDADPLAVQEAMEELVEAVEEEVKEVTEDIVEAKKAEESLVDTAEAKESESVTDNEYVEVLKKVYEKLEKLEDAVEHIKEEKYKESDPLKKLEDELSGEGDSSDGDEEDFIEPADDINEEVDVDDEEGPVMPEKGKPVNPLKDAALKEIRRMKPIIAKIEDAAERKTMADSMEKLIRATYGLKSKGGKGVSGNKYAAILEAQQKRASRKMNDGKSAALPDIEGLGDKIAEKHFRKSNNS